MSSNSELSFGARLKNANDMITYISGFSNYKAPRANESPEEMKSLTDNIERLNTDVAAKLSAYRTNVSVRLGLFNGANGSLNRLLSPISKAVAALYGNKSDESVQVRSIIRQMRNTRLEKAPVTAGDNQEAEEGISRSQRSYGSMAQFFKDLVTTLGKFNGYVSSNIETNLENLNLLWARLNEANEAVAVSYQQLKEAQKQRAAAYTDRADRVRRVKMNVASQYGNTSKEYKMMSRLRI